MYVYFPALNAGVCLYSLCGMLSRFSLFCARDFRERDFTTRLRETYGTIEKRLRRIGNVRLTFEAVSAPRESEAAFTAARTKNTGLLSLGGTPRGANIVRPVGRAEAMVVPAN